MAKVEAKGQGTQVHGFQLQHLRLQLNLPNSKFKLVVSRSVQIVATGAPRHFRRNQRRPRNLRNTLHVLGSNLLFPGQQLVTQVSTHRNDSGHSGKPLCIKKCLIIVMVLSSSLNGLKTTLISPNDLKSTSNFACLCLPCFHSSGNKRVTIPPSMCRAETCVCP